ncbi:hypothetical protein Tco_0580593 [Tanacetum coccineum]
MNSSLFPSFFGNPNRKPSQRELSIGIGHHFKRASSVRKEKKRLDLFILNLIDYNVKDKQEVKKADDREIKNIKDEEGKNVEDQQDSEGDDDTNNDDVAYMRQPIEDESWFLAHEIDYPSVNEKKADHRNNKSTQLNRVLNGRDVSDEKSRKVFSVTPWAAEGGRRVLCYVQGSGRRKRKKSVGCSNGRRDCTLFGASIFPFFNPGPDSFAHKRIWDPRIKIIFLDITLRTRKVNQECFSKQHLEGKVVLKE